MRQVVSLCLLSLMLLCWMLLSCGAAAAQPAAAQSAGFNGFWTGTLRVFPCFGLRERGRCNAVNKITFTIIEDGSKISGHYTCAIGTQICRVGNAANSGKIVSGNVNGNRIQFNVIVPADVSNCRYNGVTTSPGQMRGAYSCYQGGGLIEQGSFDVTREGG